MLKLAGRGVLIVGAKRLGAVIARRLAAEGAGVAVAYRSSRAEAQELVRDLAGRGVPTALVQGDVAVEADVERMVQAVAAQLGDLSFIVDLASSFERVPLEQLDGRAWDSGMAEARGAYLIAAHAARRLRENRGPTRGHIIFFSDWAARETPYRHHLPYLTAKAAIDFMTRAFALELAPHGILVNAIAPGPTLRPPGLDAAAWGRLSRRAPLGRESSAEEIAEMVVTLLRCETITGETIGVDSGRHVSGTGSGMEGQRP